MIVRLMMNTLIVHTTQQGLAVLELFVPRPPSAASLWALVQDRADCRNRCCVIRAIREIRVFLNTPAGRAQSPTT